jgi:hypothetical protein
MEKTSRPIARGSFIGDPAAGVDPIQARSQEERQLQHSKNKDAAPEESPSR